MGAAAVALAAGVLIGVAGPASAAVHPAPPGCMAQMTWYVGLAQCSSGAYAFQALVRCSDGTYLTGPWINGPSPVWSQTPSCYAPGRWATDVWVNTAG